MKNLFFGVILALLAILIVERCTYQKQSETQLVEQTALLQEQLKNVGKLVVTEGHFSQVFNYKNATTYFADLLSAEKKALVVVNADVTIAYDLSKIQYNIDQTNKTLTLTSIPEAELKIYPELKYYDIQADFLNPFQAEDYNKISDSVKQMLQQKIEASSLKANAQNRLLSELSKLYILTNSLGWTLQYNNTPITEEKQLGILK